MNAVKNVGLMALLLASPAALAAPDAAPADPPALKLDAVFATNLVFNTGTPAPTFDVPAGAAAGSLVGDGLPSDGSLLLTARQSKFGMQLFQRLDDKTTVRGHAEVDFFGLHENGGPAGVVQTTPRLRLAYGAFQHGAMELRGGQDWSVVTPRVPTSAGHMSVVLHSFGGAIWNRLPQLTLRHAHKLGDNSFGAALSVVRSHSGDAAQAIGRFEGSEPGTASQTPAAQARFYFQHPVFELGLAGHFANEKYATVNGDADVASWLGSADLQLTLKPVVIAGQGYCGENINGLFSRAGIKRTLDADDAVTDVEALSACGGWLEARIALGPVTAVVSGSAELGDEDNVGDGTAFQQWDAFASLMVRPYKPVEVSLEYLRNTTSYKGSDDAINDSVSLNARYFFDVGLGK